MSATVYPTVAEQYMLELVNRARANPSAEASADGIALNEGLAAGTISADAKQPLAFNPSLITAARNHTDWMMQTGTFAHDEGSADPGTQMTNAGYQFAGSWTWGQNIAWSGTSPAVPPLNATTAALEKNLFVDANEPGRGHRLNLLDPQFQEIGIGVSTGTFQGFNAVMATQDFATRGNGAFLTGVAYTDANANNFYDPGEGLGNITVTATRAADGAQFSTTTWAAGGYSLPLSAGTYSIAASGTGLGTVNYGTVVIGSQNVEADFTPAQASKTPAPDPVPSPNPTPPPMSPPAPTSPPPPPSAPVHTPASPPPAGWVTGMLFNDKNDNGTRDRGEGLIAGWRVFADLNGDGKWERGEPFAITNTRGMYRLKLSPGNYAIREVPRGYWAPSTPVSAQWDITLDDGQTLTNTDFANRFEPPVRVRR
ncbi:MAG TPA: carboxypeptidase regulatory-like domain-containing protein [Tepidisphaeraceae bacterium]|jgi:uncharacterized protein YkwD